MINDPASACNKTVTTITGRTASPTYVRRRLSEADIAELIEAYRAGTTAKVLAERYDVHYTTVKKKLRKYGVRRSRP
jgi:transcriptional regulator of aromatic amino acid metabolism